MLQLNKVTVEWFGPRNARKAQNWDGAIRLGNGRPL